MPFFCSFRWPTRHEGARRYCAQLACTRQLEACAAAKPLLATRRQFYGQGGFQLADGWRCLLEQDIDRLQAVLCSAEGCPNRSIESSAKQLQGCADSWHCNRRRSRRAILRVRHHREGRAARHARSRHCQRPTTIYEHFWHSNRRVWRAFSWYGSLPDCFA